MKVVVLDGNQRSALAVTRSLGRRGIKVIVGEEEIPSLSSCSKYCAREFWYPSPYKDVEVFLREIRDFVAFKSGTILLPMTDVTVGEILKKREKCWSGIKIPFADYNRYIAITDKVSLFHRATDLDIQMPKTLASSDFNNGNHLINEAAKFDFPVVIKPALSKIRRDNRWINAGVRYARDLNELRDVLNHSPFDNYSFLIQEKIDGPGVGIFLLMQDGEVLARFAHKRVREKPPSGGVSVVCESIELPSVALHAATKLLKSVDWFGVAMVEFKWDNRDNSLKLLEVNGRFWGSLQLAISAGVDFPYLLYCIAAGEKMNLRNDYKIGLRLRWELGDLDHLLIRIRKQPRDLFLPRHAPSRLAVLKDFILSCFSHSVKNEILRLDDPTPFVFELKQYIRNTFL